MIGSGPIEPARRGASASDAPRAANAWQAAGWAAFALIAVGLSFDIEDPFAFGGGISPSFWPRAIALLLLVAAGCLAVGALSARRPGEPIAPTSDGASLPKFSARKFLLVTAPLLFFVFLCETIGFLLATPVFLFGGMAVLARGQASLRRVAAVSGGVLVAIVVLLVTVSNTPLPPGVGIFNVWNAELVHLLR